METQMYNQTQHTDRFSTYLAIGSFGIGTLILLLYLLVPDNFNLLITGFLYVMIASFFNLLIFSNLLYRFITHPNNREILAIKMLIMLANIPIAILYFYIAMHHN